MVPTQGPVGFFPGLIMNVLAVTILVSVAFAVFFVLMFLSQRGGRSGGAGGERDALLPLDDDDEENP